MTNRNNPVLAPFRLGNGLPRLEQFEEAVRDGWLSARTRVTAGGATYRLYNYTKGAQYERYWNDVTLVARGLIVCVETGEVVAAPLSKFFNLGEQIAEGVAAAMSEGEFEALVKMDGSLGIGYRIDGSMCWATRGSFDSTQSAVAQQIWEARYAPQACRLFEDWLRITPMVEIIHPDTRVVVRYNFDDLVLIAARDRFTGRYLQHDELEEISRHFGMRLVERIHGHDVDALLDRARDLDGNHEGFVLHWVRDGHRVKVKGNEYMRLHRLLSGITPQYLAQCWFEGSVRGLLAGMPEEFREESEATLAGLDERVLQIIAAVEAAYSGAPQSDQKAFAEWVKQQDASVKGLLFSRRLQLAANFPARIAAETAATLIAQSRLGEVLPEGESIHTVVARYEADLSDILWQETRTAEGRARLGALIPTLPKNLRGELSGAIENLQPDLVVARVRAYTQQKPEFASLNVDELFAAAASPQSPIEQHKTWIFSSPLELRSFLDRWRECGRRQTANALALSLLATAIRSGVVNELVAVLAPSAVALPDAVRELLAHFESAWRALPNDQSAPEIYGNAGGTALTRVLLDQCWQSARQMVRDAYIEENKGAVDRFDDA